MAWASAIEVDAQIAPTIASKRTNRIIVSFGHTPFAPLTSIFATAVAGSLSSGRLFALAIFHAPLVLDLAGFCRIASAASVPLVATLFAAIGLLRLRETRP
jgi:hypothetical protein